MEISNNQSYMGESASYHSGSKKRGRLIWGIVATCLCFVLAVAFVIPALTSTVPNDEVQTGTAADYAAMIMVDNQIYRDSGNVLDIPVSVEPDGQIISSCETIPTENGQSNFGEIGNSYQYGKDGTLNVQIDGEWHIFKISGSENINVENFSEQEKMEIDPNYNAN